MCHHVSTPPVRLPVPDVQASINCIVSFIIIHFQLSLFTTDSVSFLFEAASTRIDRDSMIRVTDFGMPLLREVQWFVGRLKLSPIALEIGFLKPLVMNAKHSRRLRIDEPTDRTLGIGLFGLAERWIFKSPASCAAGHPFVAGCGALWIARR